MKRPLLPLFLFFCITSIFSLSAQLLPEWVNCTSGLYINDLIETPNTRWIATSGGLVKENRATGEQSFYTRGNSPSPSNLVQSIEIDKNGLLWLSTNLGIASLNVDQWTTFYDKQGLLETDHNGNIVVATPDSLSTWNGSAFIPVEKPSNIYFENSDFVANKSKEEYWLSFWSFGIFVIEHFDGQTWTKYNQNNSPLPMESSDNNPLLLDNQGRLWAGTSSGLFRFENGNWTFLNDQNTSIPQGSINALALREGGQVVATFSTFENNEKISKIMEFESDNDINIYDLPEELDGMPILNILKESDQKELLIGTKRHGLWKLDQQDWQQLPTSQSFLQSNLITQLFVEEENSWVITGAGHYHETKSMVSYLNGEWETYKDSSTPFDIESFNLPTEPLEYGPNGNLWFYSRKQIYNFKDGVWTTPSMPDIDATVDENNTLIHFTPDGKRWIFDKWTSLIFQETDQGWLRHPHEMHGGVSGTFQNITTHPATGDLWFATANGLSHYDGQQWEIFKFSNFGQTTNQVFDIAIDANGIVYATAYRGLFKYDGNTFIKVTNDNTPIPNHDTRGLAIDSQNRIWVGLANALAYLEGSEWTVFDNQNSGIPNGLVDNLAFDSRGNLWIGTNQGGLAFYNPGGVDLVLNDVLHTNTFEPESDLNQQLSIYPNPLYKEEKLTIIFPDVFEIGEKIQINLYNSSGQVACSKEIKLTNRKMVIPLSEKIVSGVYFLNVENKKKTSISTSIFIE